MDPSEQPMTGAAQRRKQQRLLSWWRHEQQSIAAALATSLHHSSRGQRKARAWEGESEMKYTAKFRTTLPPQPVLFSLYKEEPNEGRPEAFVEPRPQECVQRHTVEHITDLVRVDPCMVQILDAPVPQMGEQLPDILSFFDALVPVPEQVIEVPKILPDDVPMRTAVCDTQLEKQLVEVPTGLVYVALVLASKVYSRREIRGFLSGQGSTASGSRVVHNPVPQGRGRGGAVQNSAAVAAQIADIPARRGLSDFLPGQGSTASSSSRLLDDADEEFKGFFALFPVGKKVRSWVRTRGRN